MSVPNTPAEGESYQQPQQGLYTPERLEGLPWFDPAKGWLGKYVETGNTLGDAILPVQPDLPGMVLRTNLNGDGGVDDSFMVALATQIETQEGRRWADKWPGTSRPGRKAAAIAQFVFNSDLWLVTGPAEPPETPVEVKLVGFGAPVVRQTEEEARYVHFARLLGVAPVGNALRPIVAGTNGAAAQLRPLTEGDDQRRYVYRLKSGARTMSTLIAPIGL